MKFNLSKYSKVSSIYSVTYPEETSGIIKKDKLNPFSFTDFLKYFNFKSLNNLDYINEYNQYLKDWYTIKNENNELSLKEIIKNSYISLLKEIEFNYLTDEEQIYLKYLDYDNPLELEAAIPYFVDKLKEIIIYYSNNREYSKRAIHKWSNKGSELFIRNFIKDYILINFSKKNNIKFQSNYSDLSALNSDLKIEIEELYDYNNYYNDSDVYQLNLETFTKSIDDLSLSATEDYSGNASKSNVLLERQINQKFLASDQYLISAFETLSALDVNQFINDTETVYSPYHVYAPVIALSSNSDNLKNSNYVGNLLHPRNQVSSNYICEDFYYTPNWDKLNLSATNIINTALSTFSVILTEIVSLSGNPNFILENALVPDINYFSNDYLISKEFTGNLKHTYADGELQNKPRIDYNLKRYFPYQSAQEKTSRYNSGVSRPHDSLDFWNKDIWKNSDVYDELQNNILNKSVRERDLLFLQDKTLTKYVSDVFGNSYGIYKDRFIPSASNIGNMGLGEEELSAWGVNLFDLSAIALSSVPPELSVYDANSDSILTFDEIPESARGILGITLEVDNLFIYTLSAFNIDNSLGEYNLSSFNITEVPYISVNSPKLQTTSLNSSEFKIELSPYEKRNGVGRIYINNVYNTQTVPLTSLITENVDTIKLEQLDSKVIDLDILYDFYFIKCEKYYFYGKINFNYDDASIAFNSLQNFYIPIETDNLNKSSSNISDPKTNTIYSCSVFTNQYNLSALDTSLANTLGYSTSTYSDKISFIPVLYTLNPSNNQFYVSYNGYSTLSTFSDYTDAILPKEISTPQLSYDDHNKILSLTIFCKDIFENNILFIHTFDAKYKDFKLLSSKVIYPEKLYLTSDINNHSLSGGPVLSTYFSEINYVLLSSMECYYDISSDSLYIDKQIFKNDEIFLTYNLNDGIEYNVRPNLNYSLDLIYDYSTDTSKYVPTSSIWGLSANVIGLSGFDSAMQFNSLSAQNIIGPCDITFDFEFLKSLYSDDIVSSIYKIEVEYDDEVITLESDFTTNSVSVSGFESKSPISQQITKRFTPNDTSVKEYDISIKCHCFQSPYMLNVDFKFYVKPANIQQYFSNVEMIDTYSYNLSGDQYLDIYLETKNPQYILKNTIQL